MITLTPLGLISVMGAGGFVAVACLLWWMGARAQAHYTDRSEGCLVNFISTLILSVGLILLGFAFGLVG